MRQLKYTLIIVCLSYPLFALAGAGTRGGGEVVDINGEFFPRDVVEQAHCQWVSGVDMIKSVPETQILFNDIAKVDWYFALELEREMSYLTYCLTGPLKPLRTHTHDIPQVPSPIPSTFVGVRSGSHVLLDQNLFFSSQMSGNTRALMLAHETMHSYIPMNMNLGERRIALFSMVNALARIQSGVLTSREELHLTMRESHVEFPLTVSELDPYRTQISFVLGNDAQKARMLLAATEVDKLVRGHYNQLSPLLAPWDEVAIQISPEGALTEAYRAIIRDGTPADIDYALEKTSSIFVSPATIALAELAQLTPDQKAKMFKAQPLLQIIKGVLDRMNSADVSICDLRLCANLALQDWAGVESSSEPISVVSLPNRAKDRELSIDWKAITNGIVELVQTSQWTTLENLIQLPEFSSALKLDRATNHLAGLTAPLPREKQYSEEALEELRTSSLQRAFAVFDSTLEPADSVRVTQMIKDALNTKGVKK